MFRPIPKTPQEFFKVTSSYLTQFPKNETDVKALLEKVKAVFQAESKNSKEMWQIYQKATTGDASVNEIAKANKIAHELMVSTRFAFLLAIPGTVFVLPMLVEFAKEFDVDLIPTSVAEEFAIG